MQSELNISLKGIQENWKILNKLSYNNASAVVKANAYGFGLIEVSEALHNNGCSFFYVAQLEEGINLRKKLKSKRVNIAIFEGLIHDLHYYQKYKLIPIVNDYNQIVKLEKFNSLNKNRKIQCILNFDSGMNRLGFEKKEMKKLSDKIENFKNVDIVLLMSHLSNANLTEHQENKEQLKKLQKISKSFENLNLSLSNTNGILLGHEYILNQTRPGIGMYGLDANGKNILFEKKEFSFPFVLKCPIIQIRNVKKGQRVSYNGLTQLARNSVLATIGIGYADGILRILRKQIKIKINNIECKIVGAITMDSIIIDVTDLKNSSLKVGDYVELCNKNNFFTNFIKNSNVNIYEFFTLLSDRIVKNYN